MDASQILQLIAMFLALMELFLSFYILLLNPRHTANRHVGGLFLLIASSNLALGMMFDARNAAQGALPTWILSATSPALIVVLFLIVVVLLKPNWLRGRWRWAWWPVYGLIFLPGLLTLVDLGWGTQLWYTGLDAGIYRGGYVSMSGYIAGSLSPFIKTLTLNIAPLAVFIPLLYVALVDKKVTRLTRWLAWRLLGVQIVAVVIELGLRNLLIGGAATLLSSTVFVLAYGYAAFRQVFPEQRSRLRLMWKVLIPLVFGVIIVVGVLVWQGVNAQINLLEAKDKAELSDHYAIFMTMLDEHAETMLALSTSMANLPDVQQAFAEQDRDELARVLSSSLQKLADEDIASAVIFHLPPATPFFHLFKPQIEGQDVSKIRPMVVKANTEQQPLVGIEPGVFGLPIRGMMPVHYQGEHIGLVDTVVFIDAGFLEHVKERMDDDLTIYIPAETATMMTQVELGTDAPDGFRVYATTTQTRLPVAASFYQQVMADGAQVFTTVSDQGDNYTVMLSPLVDYADNTVGIVEFIVSRDVLLNEIAHSRNTSLLFGAVLALALLLGMVFYLFKVILQPISAVRQGVALVGSGDLTYRLDIRTGDEIEQLAGTFNQMTVRLGNMVGELEVRTAGLEQRSAYLTAAAAVGRAAGSILESELLIHQVVDLIKERFNLYYVGLFLVEAAGEDAEDEWAVLQAGTGAAGQEMLARGHRFKVGAGMIGGCIANQEARIALDVGVEAVRFDNPLLPETHSEGALPLRSRGRVLGALTVQSAETAAFDQDTVSVLQVMADQVAVALDNAELLARSQAALEAARRAYGEVSHEAWSEVLRARSSLGYRAAERGVTALGAERAVSKLPELVLPIRVRGNVIGTVVAHKPDESGAWTAEERALAETLITNLDVALESARLYEDSQRRAARERLTTEITDKMRQAAGIEDIVQTAVDELYQALGTSRAFVRLGNLPAFDDETERVED